jgi:hypothetical protein
LRVSFASLSRFVRRFAREERGVITVQNLFLTIACCAIGSIGLDVTHFYAARTELQVAADIGAHSALYLRYNGRSEADARTGAIDAVEYGMPDDVYGEVLEPADIVFGTWDAASDEFEPLEADSTAMPTAVQVTTNRAGDNPVGSFLFRIVGIDEMDVRASAVYLASGDPCAQLQGVFAVGDVTPNSHNTLSAGICVHSETGEVDFKNDQIFMPDSHVSAPDAATNVKCSNKCTGFEEAKRNGTYDLEQFLAPIRDMPGADTGATLLADVKEALPNWSNWTVFNEGAGIRARTAAQAGTPSNVTGRVNYIDCGSSGGTVELGGAYTNAVLLLNNCTVKIKKNNTVSLSNTIIYTTSTDKNNSIAFSGSGHGIGMDPTCSGSGAAAILTRGGFNTASGTKFQNATVRALGDVSFAAGTGAQDVAGVSIIAGGAANLASHNLLNACPPDPNDPPQLVTFRLAH